MMMLVVVVAWLMIATIHTPCVVCLMGNTCWLELLWHLSNWMVEIYNVTMAVYGGKKHRIQKSCKCQ